MLNWMNVRRKSEITSSTHRGPQRPSFSCLNTFPLTNLTWYWNECKMLVKEYTFNVIEKSPCKYSTKQTKYQDLRNLLS